MRVQSTQTTFFRFGNKVCFENNKRMRGEIIEFLIIKQIKKPQPCSVLLQSSQEATRADSRSLEYTRLRLVFLDFSRALVASCVHYNRTEHGRPFLLINIYNNKDIKDNK